MKTGWIKRVFSTRGIMAVLLLVYISYGIKRCHEENDVIKLEFNEFNPPIYDFPFNKDSIANVMLDLKNDYGYMKVVERKEDLFKLKPYGYSPRSYTYVYRKNYNKSVHLHYDLLVMLDSLSLDSTRVIVREINSNAQYGVRLWKGPTFQYYWYDFHDVPASGIREYEFLRVLGKKLGYLDKMPYVKYPKELSQQMIIYRLHHDLFTVDEIFEHPDEGLKEWYDSIKYEFRY